MADITPPTRAGVHAADSTESADVDLAALARELERVVAGEVRFDAAARALYATDASHYAQTPLGLVVPRTTDDVIAAVAVCRRFDVPVLMRGGGTSLAGQGCNAAVVLDVSRHLNQIIAIDPERRTARVQPGVVLDDLRKALRPLGLTFGPDPATHAWCTLGGMIGNNACGTHSITAGRTSDNVESLDLLLYDGTRLRVGATRDEQLQHLIASGGRVGQIYRDLRALRDQYADEIRTRYPDIPRRVSGYNLDELLPEHGFHVARALVGSEGTCAIVLEATLRLLPRPPVSALVVLGYGDVAEAGDAVPAIMAHGPIGLEGMADTLIDNMRAKRLEMQGVALLPPGRAWLMAEFAGDTLDQARERSLAFIDAIKAQPDAPAIVLMDDPADLASVYSVREAGVGASGRLADGKDTWSGWEDAAVPPDRLGEYLRRFQQLLDQHHYRATLYGHFGQGCIHTRIDFDMTSTEGVARYRAFVEQAAALAVELGGSISGEHGDGQARAELLPRMFGESLIGAFTEFKAIWDPTNKLNPGKLVAPFKLDEHLRLGPNYTLPQIDTHFHYPNDQRHFARAAARCIGVGKCRRNEGGTMCPSYQVTREEQHTTRGRARLLFDMANGAMPDGWQSEAVKQSLDLCLACKGCRSECPAGVDIATYKAEFLAHYYANRRRPRAAYAFGLIDRWARCATALPGSARLVNLLGSAPGIAPLIKRAIGMSPRRALPRFAPRTFKQWFAAREVDAAGDAKARPRVVLWADTFSNHFQPHIAMAAVRVLEQAGFRVDVPRSAMCCGRPLYDFGMLDRAKANLQQILHTLRDELRRGVPIVGLEPSCVAVFRDELVNLLPDDPDAHRLRQQACTLAEFLTQRAARYVPPRLSGRVLFHAHCHQKSVLSVEPDLALLRQAGLTVDVPDTGCCGMAGSFGFKREHDEISRQIGERVLLPAVRAAEAQTLIVTDGFSCREQIAQETGRRALHLAEVLGGGGDDKVTR